MDDYKLKFTSKEGLGNSVLVACDFWFENYYVGCCDTSVYFGMEKLDYHVASVQIIDLAFTDVRLWGDVGIEYMKRFFRALQHLHCLKGASVFTVYVRLDCVAEKEELDFYLRLGFDFRYSYNNTSVYGECNV